MNELNPEDVQKLTEPNAIGGVVRVRSNSNIEIKINPTQEPITQFIDAVLQLANHHMLDILPTESKGAALKYLSSIMGAAPTLEQDDRLQQVYAGGEYLFFAKEGMVNIDDIFAINSESEFKINVVRVR